MNSQRPLNSDVVITFSPAMRVARIVVNHARAILDEALARKGYLFYPIIS